MFIITVLTAPILLHFYYEYRRLIHRLVIVSVYKRDSGLITGTASLPPHRHSYPSNSHTPSEAYKHSLVVLIHSTGVQSLPIRGFSASGMQAERP